MTRIRHQHKVSVQIMQCHIMKILVVTSVLLVVRAVSNNVEPRDASFKDLLVRGGKPEKPDTYLVAAYPVTEQEAYIYKFEAIANASIVHHILVYGCNGEPHSDKPFWQYTKLCKTSKYVLFYAWAKNAQPTVLPKDVGLKIGQSSTIKIIIVQVHYAKAFPANAKPDYSGIRIYLTHTKLPYVAGLFAFSTNFFIPPGRLSYPVDITCQFKMKKSIFPFAYMVHSHDLGRVITGYLFNDTYHQIGKGNPQWPQTFYPIKTQIEVKPGDLLAVRCTYNSMSMTHSVLAGSKGNDEMCNFFFMFYTDSSVENPSGKCNSDDFAWLIDDITPKDVSEPLPPNPELEEEAKGTHHNHHGGSNSETPPVPLDAKADDVIINEARSDKKDRTAVQ